MTRTNIFLKHFIALPLKTVFILAGVCSLILLPAASVRADTFDEQIRALQREISGYQDQAAKLRAEATTLQNELGALQAERNTLQTQINLKEAELQQINADITAAELRLQNQMALLAANLRSMYLESTISPLEMVASSSSISDYIDKQEYRNKIREQVQKNIGQVRKTKQELAEKKVAAEKVLADQKAQKEQLIAKEEEQATLLAQTQGQEASFQELTKERNAQVAELRAQQAALNRRAGGTVVPGDPGHGGYPAVWDNAPMNTYVDNWGMYSRQCVSYTAFRVWNAGKYMPYWGGRGNANQWDDNAEAAGIPTGSEPRAGAVAIDNAGFYGHAMYVEAVLPGGQIYVSQYNYGWTGEYSEMTRTSAGLVYIYFE